MSKTGDGNATSNGQRKGVPNGCSGYSKTKGTKMCADRWNKHIYSQMNAEYETECNISAMNKGH